MFLDVVMMLAGMDPAAFAAVEKYKLDRLCEIYEPLVVPELDALIGAMWKPIQCVAARLGSAVNDFLDSVYCITVSESALGAVAQSAQEEKAAQLTSKANAAMAAKGLPHRMLCHNGIHSALRTFVFHKEAAREPVCRRHTATASARKRR